MWTNYIKGHKVVLERIDRFLCSTSWMEMYLKHECSNLSIIRSDHSPLFLNTVHRVGFIPRPTQFEAWWLLVEEAVDIMRNSWNRNDEGSQLFKVMRRNQWMMKEVRKWNTDRHGNIIERIKSTSNSLATLQAEEISDTNLEQQHYLNKELDQLLEKEHLLWAQESRMN